MSDRPEVTHKPVSPRVRASMAALALSLCMVAVYAFVAFPVFAHRAQQYFGISEGYLGLLLSSGAIGSLFSLLLMGPVTDRLGPRRTLQLSLVGTGGGFLMCAMVMGGRLFLFQAGLLTIGFFGAAQAVSLPTFLICVYPQWRRRMVTISLVSVAVPGVLFPIFAQWLIAAVDAGALEFADALHAPFALGALILMLGQILLNFGEGVGEAEEAREERPRFELRSILTGPALLIILCATLHAGADNALYGWLPKFLESRFEALPIGPGVMLGLYSAAYTVSRLLLAALPEGVGQRVFLALPGPIGAALLIAATWLGGPLAIALAYPLAALFFSVEYPALLAEIRETSPAHFSAIYGALMWTTSLLTIVNVNLIGQVGERLGDLRIGLTIAALGFIAFGLIAFITGMGRTDGLTAGGGGEEAEQGAVE